MLGGWRVQQDGVALERFRTRKTAALLAYLAYHPHRTHQREALAELLWPETTPELGLKSLGVALSSLRRLLEPPGVPEATVLNADRHTVQLNPAAIETDVARFDAAVRAAKYAPRSEARRHALETALDAYGGDLLPGFYEDWVIAERERLGLEHAGALDALVAVLEGTEEWGTAIPHLLRRVHAAPYDEDACGRLMRAFVAAGQPDAALGYFETLDRRLREEMGAEPRDVIKALATRIRATLPTKTAGERPRPLPRRESLTSGATPPPQQPADAEPPPARVVRLPLALTRFFGRETELERIAAWLADPACRLLTLTGPGGSGKTRLAVEAAKRLAGISDGRVLFVPLAGLSAPSQVLDVLLNTLGAVPQVPDEPQRTSEQQVVAALSAAGPTLLLLDNMEHLLLTGAEPAASLPALVSLLLEQAPSAQILATSRQPIGLEGEQEFPVAPLPTPTKPGTPERLLEFASVCLLVDRARLRQPDFQVTPHNAEAVAALCQKLDGIPLAIELAAGWLRVLPPASLLTQLDSGFDNLVNRQRNVPERHQTLYAAIEWGYRLLSPDLQAFLRRLSVFRGGWTVEAAQAICAEPRAQELLTELVERSLVVADTAAEIPRYRMLETIRHFLGDRLDDSGEGDAVRARHLASFLSLAEEAEPHLYATNMAEKDAWFRRLESEQDNLRAALEASKFVENGTEQAIRLAQAIWLFWRETGYSREARRHLAEVLAREAAQGRTLTRANALNATGALTLNVAGPWTGYPGKTAEAHSLYEEARELFEEALGIWRELGDREGIALAVKGLGVVRAQLGDFAAARALIEECILFHKEAGYGQAIIWAHLDLAGMAIAQGDFTAARRSMEQALTVAREIGYTEGMAIMHDNLGDLAQDQGDFTTAQRHFQEALALHRAGGRGRTMHSARMLLRLGQALCETGDYAAARGALEEALALCWELGDPRLPYGLTLLARVALNEREAAAHPEPLPGAGQGRNERAARLLGAAEAASQALGKGLPVASLPEFERTVEMARAALGEEVFAAAWAEGRAMTVEQVVAHALQRAGE
jgi:predicted ATPase/DNA-binding SARP family transcriptional activator